MNKLHIEVSDGCDGVYHIIGCQNRFWYFDEDDFRGGHLHLHEFTKNGGKWAVKEKVYNVDSPEKLTQFEEFKDARCVINQNYHRCDFEIIDDIIENFDGKVIHKLEDIDWYLPRW